MTPANARLRAYRKLAQWLRPLWSVETEFQFQRRVQSGGDRIWFHGASAGEWEGLTPIVTSWCADKGAGAALFTVFSRSGAEKVERLKARICGETGMASVEYAGLSPREGEWRAALAASGVRAFVTWRYDLWPDLLASLAELGIPLVVVGGSARRSLRVALTTAGALGVRLPRMLIIPFSERDRAGLVEAAIAGVEVAPVCADSRWDRVFELSKSKHARADELWRGFGATARESAVLAQVWPEDLEFWLASGAMGLAQGAVQLWIVPHRVDEESVQRLKGILYRNGLTFVSTSGNRSQSGQIQSFMGADCDCVFVDEMGVLNGLYPQMSWAYVGGGLGKGIHSVIEPALYGIPVAVARRGTNRFPEVAQLSEQGQLSVVPDGDHLVEWVRRAGGSPGASSSREDWRARNEARRGGGAAIVAQIRSWLNSGMQGAPWKK